MLILVSDEPHINWFSYVNTFLQIFSKAKLICLLGSLIDKIPHAAESLISGIATTTKLLDKMKENKVEPINYIGPKQYSQLIFK